MWILFCTISKILVEGMRMSLEIELLLNKITYIINRLLNSKETANKKLLFSQMKK